MIAADLNGLARNAYAPSHSMQLKTDRRMVKDVIAYMRTLIK